MPVLYFDEDSQDEALLAALRRAGLSVTSSAEHGMNRASDEDQLSFAAGNGWVIVTANAGHFADLHRKWARAGKSHSGIFIRFQQVGVGENARRIESALRLFDERIGNEIFYLTAAL